MLKGALVGFGGIARMAHLDGWKTLEEKGLGKLVAACDIDENQFSKKTAINIGSSDVQMELRRYTDLEQMLATEEIDVIDICVPTPLHASIACALLRRGYHVHCEKPMARTSGQCDEMIKAARESGSKLMIGQCLRFSNPYLFIKESIENNTFGKPLSAVFRRMSSPPVWASNNWYMDHKQSGGCLFDMHIHDIDMIRFLFGEPKAVSCVTRDVYSGDDIAHSRLIYDNLAVFAIGDWSLQGVSFSADYRIGFEKATVILEDGKVTVYPREGEAWTPEFVSESMYMKELEFFLSEVVPGKANEVNPPESAAKTIQLIETLKASAQQSGAITEFQPTDL